METARTTKIELTLSEREYKVLKNTCLLAAKVVRLFTMNEQDSDALNKFKRVNIALSDDEIKDIDYFTQDILDS